jgi:hypothetical protein
MPITPPRRVPKKLSYIQLVQGSSPVSAIPQALTRPDSLRDSRLLVESRSRFLRHRGLAATRNTRLTVSKGGVPGGVGVAVDRGGGKKLIIHWWILWLFRTQPQGALAQIADMIFYNKLFVDSSDCNRVE